MRSLSLSPLLLCCLWIAAAAQSTSPPQQKSAAIPSLAVEVQGGKNLPLTVADLAKLPRKEVKAKDRDGKEATYSGVELLEILLAAGAIFGKEFRGVLLGNFVLVEAADGYKAVFAAAELDTGFTDRSVILADTKDGKLLPETHGPWQLIVPDDKKHGRWVRKVTAVRLKSAR